MKTYSAKPGEVERLWYIVDVAGKPLGRMASQVARMLQGKTKPRYTPHTDTGDFVVVVNASKVLLTGKKARDKMYYRHSGWVGKIRSTRAADMLERKPSEVFRLAVLGMMPKSKLGRNMLRKLKIYGGACPAHGYAAQKARPLEI